MTKTAYDKAIELLSLREHAEKELYQKLLSRKFPKQEVRTAIEQLKNKQLLSEQRFREQKVRSLIEKQYGPRYIYNYFRSLEIKLSVEEIEAAYKELESSQDAQITALLRKRPDLFNKPQKETKARHFLARRGFSSDAIEEAIKHLQQS